MDTFYAYLQYKMHSSDIKLNQIHVVTRATKVVKNGNNNNNMLCSHNNTPLKMTMIIVSIVTKY